MQTNTYYPYGSTISTLSSGTPTVPNDYKYNNKEFIDDLGLNMLDYGARLYDPLTARWNGVDALAEKYHSTSGYGYVAGNPINAVDLDGREVYYTRGGKRLGQIGSSTQVVVIDDQYAVRAKRIIDNFNNLSCTDETRYFDEINGCGGYLGMTEEELNTRATLSLLMAHESCYDNEKAADPRDKDRYRMKNGMQSLVDVGLKKHPGLFIAYYTTNKITGERTPVMESAAGAYQFTETSWGERSKLSGVTDFSARSQDKTAVDYIAYLGAMKYIKKADVSSIVGVLKGVWVSLPGGSQAVPNYTMKDANNIFSYFKVQELKGISIVDTPRGQLIREK